MKVAVLVLALTTLASAQILFPAFSGQRSPQRPQSQQRPVARPSGGRPQGAPSGGAGADDNFGGSEYHFSWRHDGRQEYAWSQAQGYCQRLGGGWQPISIESPAEDTYAIGIISRERLQWIWTSGQQSGGGWRWASGAPFSGINWSHTGGFQRPQPDNREGNESCLAILNNFYQDGIKWHDVACHHRKPIICERN